MPEITKVEVEAAILDIGGNGYLKVSYDTAKRSEVVLTHMIPYADGSGYRGETIRVPLRRLASILAAAETVGD
jgi:hypothetical protein